MAEFLSALDARQIGPDRWLLLSPLIYQSDMLGQVLTVPKGFVTDFDSIPRWFPLAYAVLSGAARAPAVIHDLAYQQHAFGERRVIRKEADDLVYEAMRATGPGIEPVPLWKRWIIWTGVRLGGRSAWTSGPGRLQILWNRRRRERAPLTPQERERLDSIAQDRRRWRGPPPPP